MSESGEKIPGQCLCGAVRFEAVVARREMHACHCSICRRWSGGVFLSVECESVEIADEAALGVYVSSEWAERCFCRQCGASLIWRSRDGSHHVVSVQAFGDPSAFRFASQIFIDEKPSSYSFADSTRNMTGAEVFAMFADGAQQ